MKILYVYGAEYSALSFEKDGDFTVEQITKLCEENNGNYTIANDDYYAEFKLYEFGEVDSKFIDFVYNEIQDYNFSKDCNFYIVED